MEPFWISDIVERNGEKTLYINPLPEKYCTFDCVFCPMEMRTSKKTDQYFHFEGTQQLLSRLETILSKSSVDNVFIMPDGEGLANADLTSILEVIKRHGCKSKIISNGYLFNHPQYKEILLQFDEVIGELMTVNEEDFQKLQRPIEGYSLGSYVENMAAFRKDFTGDFNLSITLLKNYSDDAEALKFFRVAVAKIKPNNIYWETPEEGKLQQAFGVNEDVIEKFKAELGGK